MTNSDTLTPVKQELTESEDYQALVSARDVMRDAITRNLALETSKDGQLINAINDTVSEVFDSAASHIRPFKYGGFLVFGDPEQAFNEQHVVVRAFERLCLVPEPANAVEHAFTRIVTGYHLPLTGLSYYVRELDAHSKYSTLETVGPHAINRFRHELAKRVVHAFVESFLIREDIAAFHEKLVEFRTGLQPHMLFNNSLILRFAYDIVPDPRLFAVMFGGRIESLLAGTRSKSIGQISLDKHLHEFFASNGLELSTSNLLWALEEFFTSLEANEPDWFKKAITADWGLGVTTNYEKGSGSFLSSGLFNYSGWGEGTHAFPPGHSFSETRPPANSCGPNAVSTLATDIGLNKKFRNYIREVIGAPKVGEGQWVNELAVLRLARSLTDHTVVHQWSPCWLSPQRIDIGIPSLRLGFEYNGLQHYQPVDYFGGEPAFKKLKKLDRKKRLACEANDVNLIEIPHYLSPSDMRALLEGEILSKMKAFQSDLKE